MSSGTTAVAPSPAVGGDPFVSASSVKGLLLGLVISGVAGTSASMPTVALLNLQPAMTTHSGVPAAVTPVLTAEVGPMHQRVRALYDRAGLSWEELARALGVSRRAVHQWAVGGRINSAHLEVLFALEAEVNRFPFVDRESTRLQLLTPSADGFSPYRRFIQRWSEATTGRRALGHLSPSDLVGGAGESHAAASDSTTDDA
jgi:transcriptional regulator with XRE-family HTH domain